MRSLVCEFIFLYWLPPPPTALTTAVCPGFAVLSLALSRRISRQHLQTRHKQDRRDRRGAEEQDREAWPGHQTTQAQEVTGEGWGSVGLAQVKPYLTSGS